MAGEVARPGELDPGWVERVAELWDGWAVGEDGVIRTLYLAGDRQPLSAVSRRALAAEVVAYLEPLLDVVAAARVAAAARPGLDSVQAMIGVDKALAALERAVGPASAEGGRPPVGYEQPPLL